MRPDDTMDPSRKPAIKPQQASLLQSFDGPPKIMSLRGRTCTLVLANGHSSPSIATIPGSLGVRGNGSSSNSSTL
eukprot:CAMPEP_0181250124 /NCGR_PEP_ID=MMETSP1096-20121128/46144_1 /TAXON_ID=156174 ORGANISM="Chrysochromulina ericina, Strain CCMP281" /NCGR_SAMPLE_ID=MMETSP1096 /ASSEMBLY_ACC=CAM_ASM_000453 /LENGTH=74 /DNA_ID=CAMNT_0023347555 /DNA_START=593 /DNA_END=817 /DNA_ORIENTATION=+